MKVERILCPVDFSDASGQALEFATDLARTSGAELYVLHVIENRPLVAPELNYQFSPDEYFEAVKDQKQRALSRFVERHCGLISACKLLTQGRTVNAILQSAQAHRANLIVIATHGRSGLQHLLYGSVAERVVRLANCPVLTVKPGAAAMVLAADRLPAEVH